MVRVNRGLMWLQREEFDQAAADLTAAVALNDRQYQAWAALAQVSQRQGRPDEAVERFGRAIALRPDWSPLYRGRADVTLSRKDATPAQRASALSDLDAAVRFESPGDPVLARDHTNRGRLFRLDGRTPRRSPPATPRWPLAPDYVEAHLLRVGALLDLRRYDEVIGSCDAVLALGKPTSELYELRSLARAGLRDFAGSIEDDTQALALRPGSPRLLARRGWAYLVSDAPALALRDFEEAIRLGPSDGDSYNGRGASRVRLGRHREATADAEEALRRGSSPGSSTTPPASTPRPPRSRRPRSSARAATPSG